MKKQYVRDKKHIPGWIKEAEKNIDYWLGLLEIDKTEYYKQKVERENAIDRGGTRLVEDTR